MPTTDQPTTTSSSIVSPSQYLSRTRSFAMTNYTSITDLASKFANHPHCPPFNVALNNTYTKDFDDAVIVPIFTNANRMLVATDVVPIIQAAIMDIILIVSTADKAVIAPIIKQILILGFWPTDSKILTLFCSHCPKGFKCFCCCQQNCCCYLSKSSIGFRFLANWLKKSLLRSAVTVPKALNVSVAANKTDVVIYLNPASVFVDPTNFAVMNFTGTSVSGPVSHINVNTAPSVISAATYTTAAGLTPVQVAATYAVITTNAANQALFTQQATAAAALAATLPTKFNSSNLPSKANARYENHLNLSYLMTKTDIRPDRFPLQLGDCALIYPVYLDPPMGTGVTR